MKYSNHNDAILMLRVIDGCIKWGVVPRADSPCHKRIQKIIKESGYKLLVKEVINIPSKTKAVPKPMKAVKKGKKIC